MWLVGRENGQEEAIIRERREREMREE